MLCDRRRAADDFDKRNQMGWVKGMTDDTPFRVGRASRLDRTHGQPR